MNIYVLNTSFEVAGLIDDYTSVIWTTRYFTAGDFELYLPASTDALMLLREHYYLVREQDITQTATETRYRNVMIVEKIQIETDIEDGNHLIITGRSLKSILRRRIIWQQTTIGGKAETGIRRLITENAIFPAIEARKITGLQLAPALGLTDTIEMQFTGDNLADAVEKLCTSYGYGYDIDIVNGAFLCYLYVGADRSYNQTANPFVVFSNKFENILKTDYSYDLTNYKNVALVAGEGEGLARKTQSVGSAAGLTRYEVYVDSRNVSTNNGEYTEAEYAEMLKDEGYKAIAGNAVTESFSGEVETGLSYELNKDYFLGDVVQVQNEYGIGAAPRILEIIESESGEGISIIPTFSTWEV